jgi:5-methylcytosine-specific restriction endonuclease McrA
MILLWTKGIGMPNGNARGSSYARRARKLFLLNKFGDGIKAPCWECGAEVDYTTIVVDRITPAHKGGTYRRANIRVHCHYCSNKEGALTAHEIMAAAKARQRAGARTVR